ncbi:MAG: glycosyltransferase [Parafilimonas sp.]
MASFYKIKIALVIESLDFGGREKVLLNVANGLDSKQYEVHIIAFSNNKNNQAAMLNKSIQLHALPFNSKNLVTPSSIFFAPFIALRFNKVLKKIQPDVVHTHFLYQLLFIASASIKFSRCKCFHFHTIHTAGLYYTNKGFKNNFTIKAEAYSININHAHLVTVSKQLQQICLQYFTNKASEIRCIMNGVDDKKFDFHLRTQIKKSDFGFVDNDIIVSYVARFDAAQKDHLTLLKAWQIVAQHISNAKLCLAGDGEAKTQGEQFVKENNLSQSVYFLGNIGNINELLAITDVGVFSSLYEGLSVALLEKMFMKLPVIATNIPAFSTIITDDVSGFLFTPGDYKNLAEKLMHVLPHKQLQCAVGNEAYNAVKDYTIQAMVKKHDEYYRKIVSA